MEQETKAKQPYNTLHIRFSSSADEARDPAGIAAKVIARLKRWLQKANKTSCLRNFASLSKPPLNSSDPFNQGRGFGTSIIEGFGSATLVLQLPDERCTSLSTVFITSLSAKY